MKQSLLFQEKTVEIEQHSHTYSHKPGKIPFSLYQLELNDILTKCGYDSTIYAIINSDTHALKRMVKRPVPCNSPYCEKCSLERQSSLYARYLPFFSPPNYYSKKVRHLILTTKSFPIDSLKQQIPWLLKYVNRFDALLPKIRKILIIELKHNKARDTYFFHGHALFMQYLPKSKPLGRQNEPGIIPREYYTVANAWKLATNTYDPNDLKAGLMVKVPEYGNRKSMLKNKYASLSYVVKRKATQALTINPEDYYNHLHNRQLIRISGYPKPDNGLPLRQDLSNKMRQHEKDNNPNFNCPTTSIIPHSIIPTTSNETVIRIGNLSGDYSFKDFQKLFREKYKDNLLNQPDNISAKAVIWQTYFQTIQDLEELNNYPGRPGANISSSGGMKLKTSRNLTQEEAESLYNHDIDPPVEWQEDWSPWR